MSAILLTVSLAIIFICVGIGSALFGYLSHMMWITVGEKVIVRIRARYFESLLAQEVRVNYSYTRDDRLTDSLGRIL